jgi:hypothetical protein
VTHVSRARRTGLAVAAVAGAAIVAGLYMLGAPAEERARRLDERRVQELSALARGVDVYWTRTRRLPASLDEVRAQTGAAVPITDPGTNTPYEFSARDGARYEVCATFDGESAESGRGGEAGFWSHRGGRQCFEREAMEVR